MRVGLGEEQFAWRAFLHLNDELQDMSQDDIKALGQSIFSVLKAKSAKESDSPILKGKIFPNRKSNRGLYEDLFCDSGCTKSIVSKQICQDFKGNTNDREILISLKILKTWGLIHATFPQESVFDFMNRMNKTKKSAYSVPYSNNIENQIYEHR